MAAGISSWRGVHAGTCYAWPLPADATCATVARQAFRDAVSEVGLEPDLLEDGVLMASELAANTLHAQAVAGAGGRGESARVRGRGHGGRAGRVRLRPRPLRLTAPPATVRPACSRYPQPPQPPGVPKPSSRLYLRGCSAPPQSWSARSSTATAAGETVPPVRVRDTPREAPRDTPRGRLPGAGCRSCMSFPAAGGGTIPPGPGWTAGGCAARRSGSRCPPRWPTPGWWT